MRRNIFFASLLIVLLALAAWRIGRTRDGWKPPPFGKFAPQIHALETADVRADVTAALARGDQRLVGVMGIGLMLPGVHAPAEYDMLLKTYGIRVIPNTSDAIENREHERLQEAAYRYAEQYNRLLLARVASSQPATRHTGALSNQ